MNFKFIAKALGMFKGIAPAVKAFVFADGKFRKDRAIILLVAFVLIMLSVNFMGAATVEQSIELLDDFSDVIGVVTE